MISTVEIVNNTVNDIDIEAVGLLPLPASTTRVITNPLILNLSQAVKDDAAFDTLLLSGDISIRVDGVTLTYNEAKRFFKVYLLIEHNATTFQAIKKLVFDGQVDSSYDDTTGALTITVNQGDPTNLVGRIIQVTFNGSGDEWLALDSEDNNSDDTPYVFPFNVQLVAIKYTNQKNSTRPEIRVVKSNAGSGSTSSIVYTWDITSNARVAYNRTVVSSNITFSQGDKCALFLRSDNGSNDPDKSVVELIFTITGAPVTDGQENYSNGFGGGGGDDDDD